MVQPGLVSKGMVRQGFCGGVRFAWAMRGFIWLGKVRTSRFFNRRKLWEQF